MKIGIVIGSLRKGRLGESVGRWVHATASTRTDADYDLIDLAQFDVPLLTSATVPGAAKKQYETLEVQNWSAAIDGCDGFVFVTPEYNHGVPGGFKNAFDSLGSEWSGKPVGFVSYGAEGGVRAVEQWRQIVSNFSMVNIRTQVSMSTFSEQDADGIAPNERRAAELDRLLTQLVAMAERLSAETVLA